MLTKAQKKRLAKEARKLSLQIAAKGPPDTLSNSSWCRCGMGHVMQAAGIVPFADPLTDRKPTVRYGEFWPIASRLDGDVDDMISVATALGEGGMDGALVFPLLYLADVLEESARK